MGITTWVFKEFKVKPVRHHDGGYRLHVIPLDGENHGSSYTWHGWFKSVVAERYGKEAIDYYEHPEKAVIFHGYYVDDLTVQDLKDPSWYLQYFNEDFRRWIQENGRRLYRKIVPDEWKSRNSWLSVRDGVLVAGAEPLTEEEECKQWIESMCKYVSKLESWYREGRQVVYSEWGPRDALDWWLFEEAAALGMYEDYLYELKAKDPEFGKWWNETKDKIYRRGGKWWLVTLEEIGVEIPERFRWIGGKEEGFNFNVEAALEELAKDPKWSEKIEAYKMYRRGMFQDDIKKHFGVTQSAISKWISKVQGELSRRMGNEYELYRKAKFLSREDVERVVHDGRKGKPDFVVYLKDGSVEVISSKCYYSDRKSVSIKRAEIEPEIQEALRLRAQGRRVRLFVDFYNLHDKHHELREIPLDNIPPRLLFQHA